MNQREFLDKLLPMKQLIFRYALGLVARRDEAEDVTQDIYEKLWERRNELDEVKNLNSYILGSVRNLCLDKLKRRRRFDERLTELRNEERVAHQPEGFDLKEQMARIKATLPEKQQLALHLRDVECKEMAEVARVLEVDEATARVTLSRARKKIREEMQKIVNYGV